MDTNELVKTISTLEKQTKNLSLSDQENQIKETTVLNTFVRYMLHFGSRATFSSLEKQLKLKCCMTCIFKCEVKCYGKLSEILLLRKLSLQIYSPI